MTFMEVFKKFEDVDVNNLEKHKSGRVSVTSTSILYEKSKWGSGAENLHQEEGWIRQQKTLRNPQKDELLTMMIQNKKRLQTSVADP
jgi:hypothetical protein